MKVLIDGQTLSTPEVNRGIGTYLTNTIDNMVKSGMGSIIVLALYDDYNRKATESILDGLTVVSLGKKLDFNPGAEDAYNERLTALVTEYDIDILWIPNHLMLNVHALRGKPPCKTVLTVYDLIPVVYKDIYFNRVWSEQATNLYLQRLSCMGNIFDKIIAISESTKKDLTLLTDVLQENVATIYLGYKKNNLSIMPREKIENRYGVKDYILYVGGFDPRKNMEKAALAFKKLIDSHRVTNIDFLITCAHDAQSGADFNTFLEKNGLAGRVKLTGFVSDAELQSLYKHAKIFFFPSLYEGFGLPLLEAMAMGVPIAASNCSSVPEVVGTSGILFDPGDPGDMANVLYRVISDKSLAVELGQNGIVEAGKFSWMRCADETTALFYQVFAESIKDRISGRSLKIAYFSPLPPQKTGIAVYSEELLHYLNKYAEVDLFIDHGIEPSSEEIRRHFTYYSYRKFPEMAKAKKYDAIIYHMGNNTLHKYIYDTLLEYPGILVLHDYVLHPFIQHITLLRGNVKAYAEELTTAYADDGKVLADSYIQGIYCPIDFLKYPLNERIVNICTKVVVHSRYVKDLLARDEKVSLILHGRDPVDLSDEKIAENKRALNLGDRWPLIGSFGFMNRNKRIDVLIKTFSKIVPIYPDAMLLLVGDIDNQFKEEVNSLIENLGITKNVLMTGFERQSDYYRYLSCTDIVVNLRYPTMGETSGTQLDALAFGKPLIVSNIGSYCEVPDNCCWKVDVDATEEALLLAYLKELIFNGKLRGVMGKNALKYIAMNHKWDLVVFDYVKLLLSVRNK